MSNKKVYLWLVAIILLGLGLRLINLGIEPFWWDEALSFDIVKHYANNIKEMVMYLNLIEVHPPLYYVMLNFWNKIFGWQEFSSRLLSLTFGLGIIPLVYYFYNLLFKNKKMALLAAGFIAILPFQIEFSQEARPYIIYCFTAILAASAFWRYYQTKKIFFIILYGLATLAGVYLHYSYFFFAIALSLYWLFTCFKNTDKLHPNKIIIWLVTHTFIFVAYSLQLIHLLYKVLLGQQLMFNAPRAVGMFGTKQPVEFFEAVSNQLIWITQNEAITKMEILAVLIFKITIIIALVWLIKKGSDFLILKLKQDGAQLFYIIWLAFFPVLLFFISPYGSRYAPIYERHIISSSVFFVILLVYFLSLFDIKKRLIIISLFFISILNPLVVILKDDSIWDPYHRIKVVSDYININYRPGDMVLIADTISRTDINHYLNNNIPSFPLYPLNLLDYRNDFLSSRQTLGLDENEAQLRFDANKNRYYKDLDLKMIYINQQFTPQRVWYFSDKRSYNLEKWFEQNNWRLVQDSLGNLFPLRLYAKK